MLIVWLIIFIILAIFLIGIVLGAPYLPTLNTQVEAALDLINLQRGQTLIELGSGDGKVLIAAAKRGIKSVGYELNPILVIVSILRTRKFRKDIKIVWGNFWAKDWPQADGVFVFLITRYMRKLDKRLIVYKHKPIKLVSFAFKVPGKKVSAAKSGVFLYLYK